MNDLIHRSLEEHAASLRKGEYSSAELTKAFLDRIEEKDGEIGAFLTVTAEEALASAEAFDKNRADFELLSPLAGIPCAIKDNICTAGIRTTCASKMLRDYDPPYDAFVVEKLKKAGAVILGKLNMDEFAMGSSTENSAFRVCRNPADPTRVPGGSSGGSAASVAALETPFSLGSDTGGSIRQPASSMPAATPRISASRYGLIAFASSLDQIGPITKTVYDNALVLNAVAGKDARDATSVDRTQEDFTSGIEKGVKSLKIGIPAEFFGEGISKDVKDAVLSAASVFRDLGAETVDISMPSIDFALSAYYVISSAEASSNLARFDGVRYGYRTENYSNMGELYRRTRTEGFGPEVKRRIMLGTFALSSGYYDAYYKKALQVRSLVKKDFENALKKSDIILSPVAPTVAYKIGEKTGDALTMYLGDAYSVPINIAGVPALSLPCGKGEGGMPVGMQLIGPMFGESLLYRAGRAFETAGK